MEHMGRANSLLSSHGGNQWGWRGREVGLGLGYVLWLLSSRLTGLSLVEMAETDISSWVSADKKETLFIDH